MRSGSADGAGAERDRVARCTCGHAAGQGDEVSVSIGTPCSSSAAASLAQVTLGNSDERSRIEKLLAKSEALACPFRSCAGRSSFSQPSTTRARASP